MPIVKERISFENELTVCIPVYIDCEDRLTNLKFVLDYFKFYFSDLKILIGSIRNKDIEKMCRYYPQAHYVEFGFNEYMVDGSIFHRTKVTNALYKMIKSKVGCNYDGDVLFNPTQLYGSFRAVVDGENAVSYPFTFKVFKIEVFDRTIFDREKVLSDQLIPYYEFRGEYEYFKYSDKKDWDTYGLCHFFHNKTRRDVWLGENPNFIGWGCEDRERFDRWKLLGLPVDRQHGCAYHLEHKRTKNGCQENPYMENNEAEHVKLSGMKGKDIVEYMANGWK